MYIQILYLCTWYLYCIRLVHVYFKERGMGRPVILHQFASLLLLLSAPVNIIISIMFIYKNTRFVTWTHFGCNFYNACILINGNNIADDRGAMCLFITETFNIVIYTCKKHFISIFNPILLKWLLLFERMF